MDDAGNCGLVPFMKNVCTVVQGVYDADPRVRRKAEALVAAGYSVDVLALRPPGGKKAYALNGVNVHTVALGKKRGSLARYVFEYAFFFLWTLVRLFQLMRTRRYAVVDVNTLPDFLIFAAAPARWMGATLVLDMHEITPEFYMSKYGIAEDSRLIRLLTYLEQVSFGYADHVITINEPILDLLTRRGLVRSKASVVMNSVDEARFAVTSKTSRVAAPDRFVMMYHGTLTAIYGLDIAVEALALAQNDMPGAELWILGSGPEQSMLTDLVAQRGLGSRVRLIGQVQPREIPNWLSQCDVGILPIRRDVFLDFAFPNKLPEFIVAGKTVIVSRLKAIRHYFGEESLVYFEPNSATALAQEMRRLYRDGALRARFATRARQEYEHLRWDVMKQEYLRVIQAAAGLSCTIEPSRATATTDLVG
jgi:glycosyltransferase involved in cell wall biosynthesis